MKKRIFIITDNYELASFMQQCFLNTFDPDGIIFDFFYSKANASPNGLAAMCLRPLDLKHSEEVSYLVASYDIGISLHCKQVFPKELVDSLPCYNFHPGFNPFNRGWYPQAFSIINGLPIGATLHLMDCEIDHGDLVSQIEVSISDSETSYEVYRSVISAEKKLIINNLEKIVLGTIETYKPISEGNYNSIADYRAMCSLDLAHVGTLGDHIKLLRALSHADFKNAYYHDKSGNKVYIKVVTTVG